ncbi:hypothetical protein KAJ27_01870 [bacterium]|nr:hypothetical protein [bacterium]
MKKLLIMTFLIGIVITASVVAYKIYEEDKIRQTRRRMRDAEEREKRERRYLHDLFSEMIKHNDYVKGAIGRIDSTQSFSMDFLSKESNSVLTDLSTRFSLYKKKYHEMFEDMSWLSKIKLYEIYKPEYTKKIKETGLKYADLLNLKKDLQLFEYCLTELKNSYIRVVLQRDAENYQRKDILVYKDDRGGIDILNGELKSLRYYDIFCGHDMNRIETLLPEKSSGHIKYSQGDIIISRFGSITPEVVNPGDSRYGRYDKNKKWIWEFEDSTIMNKIPVVMTHEVGPDEKVLPQIMKRKIIVSHDEILKAKENYKPKKYYLAPTYDDDEDNSMSYSSGRTRKSGYGYSSSGFRSGGSSWGK